MSRQHRALQQVKHLLHNSDSSLELLVGRNGKTWIERHANYPGITTIFADLSIRIDISLLGARRAKSYKEADVVL